MHNEKSELGPSLLKHAERLQFIAAHVDVVADVIIAALEKTPLLKDHVIEAQFTPDDNSTFIICAYDVDKDAYKRTREQIWNTIHKMEELGLYNHNEFTFGANVIIHDDTVKYYPNKVRMSTQK